MAISPDLRIERDIVDNTLAILIKLVVDLMLFANIQLCRGWRNCIMLLKAKGF
jgi:hypothetical protein